MTILGYILIGFGLIAGVWGGVRHSVSLWDGNFMAYLSGAFILITAGLFCLKIAPLWSKVAAVAASVLSISIYLSGLHWSAWLFWLSVGILMIIGVVLAVPLVRKCQ